ncbi:MAG TPA: hypothetical protein ENI08_03125 [Candidatus Dependentiae bacterium]|nr:hypothetical protein [Candidatus Dependentiae bacterium]
MIDKIKKGNTEFHALAIRVRELEEEEEYDELVKKYSTESNYYNIIKDIVAVFCENDRTCLDIENNKGLVPFDIVKNTKFADFFKSNNVGDMSFIVIRGNEQVNDLVC